MKAIERFVERVSSVRFEDCFNPYADTCAVHDQKSAPNIRRNNLTQILFALASAPSVDVWVGRDLGYKGGRRTGVALTDEFCLDIYASHLKLKTLGRATNGPAVKEQTASSVFRILHGVDVPILTWNVFPLHPYSCGFPLSNRPHTREEAEVGFTFLQELCVLYEVRRIVAIGNDAAQWVRKVSCAHLHVRHPSYGGQAEFLEQMRLLYSIEGK
ncbi:uracil-DNA glycosylase [Ensifer adhaerens]|uniref:uracil-DNA glycosylase n=1 Tax=Ensifer adhaerens TaxID=106592 RepID=UPI0008073906|nr:uracil-DNA glycosylase [Ensifer adhaerens]